jgi:uncharacterized caspase-like protein
MPLLITMLLFLFVFAAPSVNAGLARISPVTERPECAARAQAIAEGKELPKRVALAVGNNRMKQERLKNAVNDARLIATTLQGLGWSTREASDVTRAEFKSALDGFAEQVRSLCPDDIALFYYSGNGFEINGISYMSTTETDSQVLSGNAKMTVADEAAFLDQMITLQAVLRSLDGHSGPKIVILDSCRDDPLARLREKGTDQAPVLRVASNTILAHSSETGELSFDDGPNPLFGPYAWALSNALKERAFVAEEMFRRVRQEVVKFGEQRGHKQSPFLSSTMTSEVFLGARPDKRSAGSAVAAASPVTPPSAGALTGPKPGSRVALVIANDTYGELPKLSNPVSDTREIAAALQRLGFKVSIRNNLTLSQVNKALRDFGEEAESADWAMIYFAGHGMELQGRTFLLPTDVELKQDKHANEEAVQLERLIDKVENAKYLGLIVLDACRDNPFSKSMKKTNRVAELSIGRSRSGQDTPVGLGAVQLDKAGVLVAYSARHGTVAYDGQPGELSPFAKSLVEFVEQPGVEVQMVFRRVRDRVMELTGQQQEPFSYGSLPGREFYFKSSGAMVERMGR